MSALAQQARLEATKVENNEVDDSRQSEIILDSDMLSNQSITNIEDTTRYLSGVQVSNTGTRFGDDGFNIRGLSGDAIAVTVDGVSQGETLNPSTFAAYGMYSSSRGQVETEHVKTVTIVKGPSSVTSGAGALAGSVAYVTNDASDFLPEAGDVFGGKVKGGYDARSEEFLLNGTIANRTGNWETLLQYTLRDGHETQAHSNGADVEGSTRGQADLMDASSKAALLKVAYNLSADSQFGVVFEHSDKNSVGTPLSREGAGSYFDFNTIDDNDRERYGIFYTQENAGNGMFDSVDIVLNYQELYTSGVTEFSYVSGDDAPYLRVEDRDFTQETTSLSIDFGKTFTGDVIHEIVYGGSYQASSFLNVMYDIRYNDTSKDSGVKDLYPIRDAAFVPKSDKTAISFYIADLIQLSDQLTANIGLRYDNTEYDPTIDDNFEDPTGKSVQSIDFSKVVGEVGLSYEITEDHIITAKIAQGYQAPTLQQLYLDTDSGGEITDSVTGLVYEDLDEISNPELNAETSINYELSYNAKFDNGSIKFAVFRTNYTDMIQDVTYANVYGADVTVACGYYDECDDTGTKIITEDTYQQAENAGEVEVTGYEFDARYRFTPNVTGFLSYSAIDGEYKTASDSNDIGDKLVTAAPNTTTLGLSYSPDTENWGVELYTLHRDSVDESTDASFENANRGGIIHYPDSFTVFDLTGYYKASENLKITAAIYNLTDEEYYFWESVNSVNSSGGSGGFATSVIDDGYQRFSEPGRSFSAYVTYTF
jgi:hemoglobin/transferrin/lactoferrin receptor protein